MPSSRRDFVRSALHAAGTVTMLQEAAAFPQQRAPQQPAADRATSRLPWYRRAYRWGQTNITEKDPERYDIAWWRDFWKRTAVQAVIVNAGGIVAYYPSKFPLQHRAEFLHGRDLFHELTEAAHADGLFVMARMDSNRAGADFFREHPDWFARNREGEPYRAGDQYVACINSPYYSEYLPGVLREIIERSRPEGFTDNSWAGLARASICYCVHCERLFRDSQGATLPRATDWDDPTYRKWILWSYERRIAIWDLNNRVTRDAGGPDCIWSGMNSGSVTAQAQSFRELRSICRRAAIVMLDHQRRDDNTGFQQNGDTGKRIHQLGGWDKLAPESMAMYQSGPGYFRLASKPAAEARMWMISGIAGGIQPWWHFIGAYHEDRRMYETPGPVMQWCQENQQYLTHRTPVASVGLVWSQRNTDFFGRESAADLVDAPYTGFLHALVRARVPYVPVHVDDLDEQGRDLTAVVLPNLGAMSDAQCASVRRFVQRGGGLLATGVTSLYDEWGDPLADYRLADLFGAHRMEDTPRLARSKPEHAQSTELHTYLRLNPDRTGSPRHPILKGFDETNTIPFGGSLTALRVESDRFVPLTFIPAFPTYPPETAWMRTPRTDIPGLVLTDHGHSRVAFLPADVDRRYAIQHLPDHGDLLANAVRWVAGEIPMRVEGPGLIDCHLYRQEHRTIIHVVNLTSANTWRAPLEEFIPVGPLTVTASVSSNVSSARLLVSKRTEPVRNQSGQVTVRIPSITDHEVIVIE